MSSVDRDLLLIWLLPNIPGLVVAICMIVIQVKISRRIKREKEEDARNREKEDGEG